MQNYLNLIRQVRAHGTKHLDRTGVGCQSIFGTTLRFDLSSGEFPAVTTKTLAWKAVVGELLWFIEGSTNVERLREITHGGADRKTIWDDNYENQARSLGYEDGELGPVYGKQWREWLGKENQVIDQLQNAVDYIRHELKTGRHNRRIIVNAWNPSELEDMALPPCHMMFQFQLQNGKLNLAWTQRSIDVFLGLPFNIASYALLLRIMCEITGAIPGDLVLFGGDTHIYSNHQEQCTEMLSRSVMPAPTLKILKPIKELDDLKNMSVSDFVLENYNPKPTIKAPMAV